MCDSPLSKRQKRKAVEEPELSLDDSDATQELQAEKQADRSEKTPDPNSPALETSYAKSHTPRKLACFKLRRESIRLFSTYKLSNDVTTCTEFAATRNVF